MILNKVNDISYDYTAIKNIIVNIPEVYSEIKSTINLISYNITNNISPELLSQSLYGSPDYEWILLLLNNIIDPFWEWPQPQEMIIEMATHKYSSLDNNIEEGLYQIHHHYDPINEADLYWDLVEYPNESKYFYHIGDSTHSHPQFIGDLVPVTNLEYELQLNDSKKVINIISSVAIPSFISYISDKLNKYYGR